MRHTNEGATGAPAVAELDLEGGTKPRAGGRERGDPACPQARLS